MTHERSDRRASTEARLARALALLSALLGASSLVVAPLNGASLLEFINGPAQSATLAVAFSVLGASILGHRSQPRIGRICCLIGVTDALAAASDQYARYALATEPGLPGGALASWLRAWTWAPAIGLLLTFLVLLFPDGRLPSRRWQPVAWSAAVSVTALAVLFAVHAWPLRGRSLLAPFSLPEFTGPAGVVAALVLLASAVASVLALVVRLGRATGIERQQLKWFAYAAVVGVIAGSLPADVPMLVALLGLVASLCLPGAIAIRRYRLYDIDRILNRTLVYGLLSAILGLSYAGVVLLLGQLAGGVTGDPPSWAVAGATLAVAALFQPARAASSRWLTGASTAASTTRPRPWRPTASDCATSSTWTPSPPSSWRSLTRPWSQPESRSGFGPPHPAPRAHPTVGHGQVPGLTEEEAGQDQGPA